MPRDTWHNEHACFVLNVTRKSEAKAKQGNGNGSVNPVLQFRDLSHDHAQKWASLGKDPHAIIQTDMRASFDMACISLDGQG